jgi:hypothetical protein
LALTVLREAADTGIANRIKSSCLTSDAQQTIKEFEGG